MYYLHIFSCDPANINQLKHWNTFLKWASMSIYSELSSGTSFIWLPRITGFWLTFSSASLRYILSPFVRSFVVIASCCSLGYACPSPTVRGKEDVAKKRPPVSIGYESCKLKAILSYACAIALSDGPLTLVSVHTFCQRTTRCVFFDSWW